jgi:hypothetical protein
MLWVLHILLTYTLSIDCWAAGAASGGCGHLEKVLRECMDAPVRYVHRAAVG